MLLSGRISIRNCSSCLHLCLVQPVWYWQRCEYPFFGRTHASLALLLMQSFHACGSVVALAQTSRYSIANAFHLPDDKHSATLFQTILLSGQKSICILSFSCVPFISVNSEIRSQRNGSPLLLRLSEIGSASLAETYSSPSDL